jgi:hypothetical protein
MQTEERLQDAMFPRALREAQAPFSSAFPTTSAFAQQLGLAASPGGSEYLKQLSRMTSFAGGLATASSLSAGLAGEIEILAPATLRALAFDWGFPATLLTAPSEAEEASMSWLLNTGRGESVMIAGLTSDAASSETVAIDHVVVCSRCGEQMLSTGTRRWVGPKKGVQRTTVFPACPRCFPDMCNDPQGFLGEFEGSLRERAHRVVRGIPGGGNGDGVSRGCLRLVKDDRDDPWSEFPQVNIAVLMRSSTCR